MTNSLSGRRFHRRYLEGVSLSVLIANGDIFAWAESVRAKAIAAFVIILSRLVVIENPAAMLGPTRLVDQKTEFVWLTFPKPAHATVVALLLPERGVDVAFAIQGRDKFITMPRRALGKLLGSGEIEPDAFETVRQGRHGLVSLVGTMMSIMARFGKRVLIWISP